MDEYLNEEYNLWILNTSEEEEEVERDDWVDDDEKGWRSQESVLKEKSVRKKWEKGGKVKKQTFRRSEMRLNDYLYKNLLMKRDDEKDKRKNKRGRKK